MTVPHIPVYRHGQTYKSLDVHYIRDHRTGEVMAEMSVANPGLIRRDLQKIGRARKALEALSHEELVKICNNAADEFMTGTLPLGIDGETQTADEYINTLSATSGMPRNMCRGNMEKIRYVLDNMSLVLKGLTRGLDLSLLDQGYTEQNGVLMSYFAQTAAMGMVMPSNSPGVNSLWLPAIPLKVGIVMKPGSEEPWTPWRLMQAFLAAGCPEEAFGFYPTTHEGANTIMNGCDRAIIFGDANTVDRYRNRPAINVHGPGWSKVLVGEDRMENPDAILDIIADSVLLNGGRSCVNASTILVPSNGEKLAHALARRLAEVKPLPLTHPLARLSAFAKPNVAQAISQMIDHDLEQPGAQDLTVLYREHKKRVCVLEESTFLQPTLIYCSDPNHALAKKEYMFPFVSVVEVPQDQMTDFIGPTLVVSAITEDKNFIAQLLNCESIDRLNIGDIPTPKVQWDQPHEGNMFEFLYKRRSIQVARHIA